MIRVLLAVFLYCTCSLAFADNHTSPFATCIAEKTTQGDRKVLIQWVFFAMGAHPEMIKYESREVNADLDSNERAMGALVTRLLTGACAVEAHQLFLTGGMSAVQDEFGILGRIAMQETMSDANVKSTLHSYWKFVDQEKMNAVLGK